MFMGTPEELCRNFSGTHMPKKSAVVSLRKALVVFNILEKKPEKPRGESQRKVGASVGIGRALGNLRFHPCKHKNATAQPTKTKGNRTGTDIKNVLTGVP